MKTLTKTKIKEFLKLLEEAEKIFEGKADSDEEKISEKTEKWQQSEKGQKEMEKVFQLSSISHNIGELASEIREYLEIKEKTTTI